jgi:hypothetical protein
LQILVIDTSFDNGTSALWRSASLGSSTWTEISGSDYNLNESVLAPNSVGVSAQSGSSNYQWLYWASQGQGTENTTACLASACPP